LTTPGPNEFYVGLVQQQLDRRFSDLEKDLDRRFNTVDANIKEIKEDIGKLESSPKDTFRAYVTPILVAVITAIVLTFLIKQGVVNQG
jgi:hypothetical protein